MVIILGMEDIEREGRGIIGAFGGKNSLLQYKEGR